MYIKYLFYLVCFLLIEFHFITGSDEQEVDETTAQDNYEDRLKSCIEGTSQKRFENYQSLIDYMMSLYDNKLSLVLCILRE